MPGGILETWPDSFPDACPPSDAEVASGSFYRLVDSDPPTQRDFMNHHELLAAGRFRSRFWPDDCIAAGLSVFGDVADAQKTRAAVGPLRKKKIAVGEITGAGRMKHTPRHSKCTHHTWWRTADDAAWEGFEVVP